MCARKAEQDVPSCRRADDDNAASVQLGGEICN
jgi:hypothetical protein